MNQQTAAQPVAMTDQEREAHIADLAGHMEQAYDHFEAYGNPIDRDSALHFMHLRDEAIASRAPEQIVRMERAIEERISCGVDYFQTAGVADARALSAGVPA